MSKRTSGAAATSVSSDGEAGLLTPCFSPAKQKQTILLSGDAGHFSLIRALHLADTITLCNGLCGVLSILTSMRYAASPASASPSPVTMLFALSLIFMGLVADFLDGKVARLRGKSSMMGQELDSLADLVSFGVSPAVAAFAIGLRTPLDHACLAFFVLCGLVRLARFNVTANRIPKDKSGKVKYFEGFPIPTTLFLDALMAYWIWSGSVHGDLPLGLVGLLGEGTLEVHPVALLFVGWGCLMTSKTIRIPKP